MNPIPMFQKILILLAMSVFISIGVSSVEAGRHGHYEARTFTDLLGTHVRNFTVAGGSLGEDFQGGLWLVCEFRTKLKMKDEGLFNGVQEEIREPIGTIAGSTASAGDTLPPHPPMPPPKSDPEKEITLRVQRLLNDIIPRASEVPGKEFTIRRKGDKRFLQRRVPNEKKKESIWGIPPPQETANDTTASAGDVLPSPVSPPALVSPPETELDVLDYRIHSRRLEGPQQIIAVQTSYDDYAANASQAGWKPVSLEILNKKGKAFLQAKQIKGSVKDISLPVQVKVGDEEKILKEGEVARFFQRNNVLHVKVINSTSLISLEGNELEGPPYGLSLKVWSERNIRR